tara:strand:- start:165 stop:284 length:120 start_codon:yes stop_codon:yes gene_type:complete
MKDFCWHSTLDKKKIKQEISKAIKIRRIDKANYLEFHEK